MSQNTVVACVQLCSGQSVADNLRTCEKLIQQASEQGAKLVVLPENFAFFGEEERRAAVAESLTDAGPIVSSLKNWASRYGVALVAGGMPELSEDPRRPYNTSIALDPSGTIVGRYRKVHLFDVELPNGQNYRESDGTTQGDEPVVVDLLGMRVGLTICYDLRFPRLFEALVNRGAEVITVPAAFTKHTGAAHWHVLLRARAIEGQTWVVAAGQWGEHPGNRNTYGHSLVVDPWGTVMGERAEGEGVCLASIDLAKVADVRQRMPLGRHRRVFRARGRESQLRAGRDRGEAGA